MPVRMDCRRIYPILAALWLQLAPLLVRVDSIAATLTPSVTILLRWVGSGAAVSGAFHALSGATGLTVNGASGVIPRSIPIPGFNGTGLAIRFAIQSEEYGIPKVYTYENLPPGIVRSTTKTDTVQGKPTQSGRYTSRVFGWEKADASGFFAEFDVLWVISGAVPVVTVQPVSHTVVAGGTVTFSVVATGEAPLSYRWFWDDLELAAAEPSLTLVNLTASQAGPYKVRVSSPAGSTYSEVATLTIIPGSAPPTIMSQTGDLLLYPNDHALLAISVDAHGSGLPVFAWFHDGVRLEATGSVLDLSAVNESMAGTYSAEISTSAGRVVSSPIIVGIAPFPRLEASSELGELRISFDSIAGRSYQLQSNRLDETASWVVDQTVKAEGNRTVIAQPLGSSVGLFRLRVAPLP